MAGHEHHTHSLNLSNRSLNSLSLQQLISSISPSRSPSVSLSFPSAPPGRDGISFSTLRILRLSFNNLGDAGVFVLSQYLPKCSSLMTLDLGFNQIGDNGLQVLCSGLLGNQSISILYLSGNCITNVGCSYLAVLLKHNHVLRRLYLSGNSILSQGAVDLSDALASNSTLSVLDLNSTTIRKLGCSSLASSLMNEFLSLSELYLGNNFCEDDGIIQLATSLRSYRKLQILDLSFNQITEIGFEYLATSLYQYPCLTTLSLSNNRLSDKSIKFLLQLIQNINTLQSLNVDYNEFSPMAILALINCLTLLPAYHKPLYKLSLSGNSMNTESAKALGVFLNHFNGQHMLSLHLDHMNIGKQGEQQIAASIASNQNCHLETVSGILLGPLMTEIGSPPQLADYNNKQVLQYVREMWTSYNLQNDSQVSGSDTNLSNSQVDEYPDTEDDPNEIIHSHSPPRSPSHMQSMANKKYPKESHFSHQNSTDMESVLRKRAASNGAGELKTQLSNTQSEDDLNELADDVQTHIRSTVPTSSSIVSSTPSNPPVQIYPTFNQNSRMKDKEPLSEGDSHATEQIKLVLKKLEQIFDPILSEVAALPFDPSNLWTLHQYYYSPSTPAESNPTIISVTSPSPNQLTYQPSVDYNSSTSSNSSMSRSPIDQLMEVEGKKKRFTIDTYFHEHGSQSYPTSYPSEDDDEYVSRPCKRPSNRLTMTRIAAYPQLKNRLEQLKSTSETQMLTILRQLRCIEEYIDKYKDQYPYFIEMDVESIILDRNGY